MLNLKIQFIILNAVLATAVLAFNKTQITSQMIASISYENFKISIYQHMPNENDGKAKKQYYYSPLMILNAASSYYTYNEIDKVHQMVFEIQMWNDELEKLIHNNLFNQSSMSVEPSQISVLPIEQVKVEFPMKSEKYRVDNSWISFSNQPKFLHFRVWCVDEAECRKLIENLKKKPEIFYGMEVFYTLDTQQSRRKQFNISREHFTDSQLFAKLSQNEHMKHYIRETDLNTLINEISSNIMSESLEDNEFLDPKEDISINSLLRQQLEVQYIATTVLAERHWNNVYWYDDNMRPDKLIGDFNALYEKSDNETRMYMLRELERNQKLYGDNLSDFLQALDANETRVRRKEVDELLVKIFNEKDTAVEIKNDLIMLKAFRLCKVNTSIPSDRQPILTRRLKVGSMYSINKNKVVIRVNRTDTPIDRISLLQSEVKTLFDNLLKIVEEVNKLKLESGPGGMIGEIRYSLLTQEQFQNIYGPEWYLLNGSTISTSDLHKTFGWHTLPDARGLFLRSKQNGRFDGLGNADGDLAIGAYQRDAYESHSHSINTVQLPASNSGPVGKGTSFGVSSNDRNTAFAGGNETRPRSITVNVFIKVSYKTRPT